MVNRKLVLFIVLQLSFVAMFCQANTITNNKFQHPLYLGVQGGYGSTTWQGLVPTKENQNSAISMSTPIEVEEGGNVWGFFAGYELTPYFVLEASYMRYPNAKVFFDTMSLFSFTNDDRTQFMTRTESANLMIKIMLLIPETTVRVYSSAGVATVHRYDFLIDHWRLSPTFGVGINYHFTEHLISEFGANYTAGFGESQLNPTDSYFPFLYSVSMRLAYAF